jgi:phenylacetate-CoA ligase
MYEIVSTSFINRAMPLLRYRTGDIAVDPFGWDDTCACGMRGPGCKQIIGRIDDLFITPDGRRIGRLDHVFKGIRHVTAAQIIQHSVTRTEIKIIRAPQYTTEDEVMIRRHFLERVGDTAELTFSYTDTIPRTTRGKFRAVVSHVTQQDIDSGDN